MLLESLQFIRQVPKEILSFLVPRPMRAATGQPQADSEIAFPSIAEHL